MFETTFLVIEYIYPLYCHPFEPNKFVFVDVNKKATKTTARLATAIFFVFSGHLFFSPYLVASRKEMIDSQSDFC